MTTSVSSPYHITFRACPMAGYTFPGILYILSWVVINKCE